MEAAPFKIQSPEAVAMEYGGDKQRIAQAMQLGVVDPTAGIMAGMFIDRMRSAAQAEQAPHQTVAQQVMAPPKPAAPVPFGAPPQGVHPQSPVPPPAGLGAPPQMMAPQGAPSAPVQHMAIGGEVSNPVPGTQSDGVGGVAALPIPDDMFKETDGNQYAQGGIIAFGDGGDVKHFDGSGDTQVATADPNTTSPQAPAANNQFASTYGIDTSSLLSQNNAGLVSKLFGAPQTKYADAREQQLLQQQSDPDKGQNQVQGIALLQLASGLMSSPSFTRGLANGIAAAVPGYVQGEKDIYARQDQINKGLADIEAGRNTQAAQRAQETLAVFGIGTKASEDERNRQSQQAIEAQRAASAVQVENLRGGYALKAEGMRAGAEGAAANRQITMQVMGGARQAQAATIEQLKTDYDYQGITDPAKKVQYANNLYRQNFIGLVGMPPEQAQQYTALGKISGGGQGGAQYGHSAQGQNTGSPFAGFSATPVH